MLSDARGGELNEPEETPKSYPPTSVDDPALSELSDPEFIGKLRECLVDRPWTIGHMRELERRGLHILDDDPALREVANEKMQSLKEGMERFRGEIANASRSFPKIDFPTLPDLSIVAALPDRLPVIEPLKRPISLVSPALEMQGAQLEALSEIREEIRELRRRGWSYWLMVTLTAIAALAAVMSVALALS